MCVYKFRNDLRKALDENEESPATGSFETTKSFFSTTPSTTTTTTTTPPPPSTTTTTTQPSTTTTVTESTVKSTFSTTQRTTKRYSLWKNSDDAPKTPKTYFSNSFYHHNSNKNQNNNLGQTYTKSTFKSVTTKRPFLDNNDNADASSTTTTTNKPALSQPTINPFYYGFNRLPRYSTASRSNAQSTTSVATTQKPQYSRSSTPYQFHHYYFTSTKKPDLADEVDNNYYESHSPASDDAIETEKPRSSTYNPVFDIYFKQIARQRTAVPKIK